MKKKHIMLLVALPFLLCLSVITCAPTEQSAGPGSPGRAAIRFFEEAHLDAPVEAVEILSVDMTDKDHAIVKVKVTYGEGMSHMPSQENYKVFLEKYGDEWEVLFVQ